VRVLFVYDEMHLVGGVQTLLLRLSRQLVESGHEVAVVTKAPPRGAGATREITDALTRHAQVYASGAPMLLPLERALPRRALPVADVIHCGNLPSLLYGLVVQQTLMPEAVVTLGVYHPQEYCWTGAAQGVQGRLGRSIMQAVPFTNVLFLSEGMVEEVVSSTGRDFSSSPVVSAGVDIPSTGRPGGRPPSPHRIVSVTRTTPYYPVHRHLVDVTAQLRTAGWDVEYHAYGAGESLEALRQDVAARGLSNAVVFHGALEYSRLPEVFDGAFAYVGLGTSLAEAAAHGVPSLVAVDSSPDPTTYGWLHDVPGGNLGGVGPPLPQYLLYDRLAGLLAAGDGDYRALAAASRRRSQDFSIQRSARDFVSAVSAAEPFSFRLGTGTRAAAAVDALTWAALRRAGISNARMQRYESYLTRPAPKPSRPAGPAASSSSVTHHDE
jgi:glycosyltransferase involved in cell wall biosynthesis